MLILFFFWMHIYVFPLQTLKCFNDGFSVKRERTVYRFLKETETDSTIYAPPVCTPLTTILEIYMALALTCNGSIHNEIQKPKMGSAHSLRTVFHKLKECVALAVTRTGQHFCDSAMLLSAGKCSKKRLNTFL
jgi:hypothetical protein